MGSGAAAKPKPVMRGPGAASGRGAPKSILDDLGDLEEEVLN